MVGEGLLSILAELKSINEKLGMKVGALDIEGAAKYLNVSPNFLRLKCREGVVPYKKLGDKYLFSPSVLDDWLANNENAFGKLRKIKG